MQKPTNQNGHNKTGYMNGHRETGIGAVILEPTVEPKTITYRNLDEEEKVLTVETELPTVSITIPTLNEAGFISNTLDTILAQDYPHDKLEIIIGDGMSDDGTRDIIAKYVEDHASTNVIPITVIDNPERIVSTALNRAILAAKGEIIVRVDGHTILDPDYVEACVKALHRSKADGVGGPMRCVGRGFVSEAIAAATSTPFGIGNSPYRSSRFFQERLVETTHMGAYRRDTLIEAGLFNKDFVRHQDYELDYRIRMAGGSILMAPEIRSLYYVRGSLKKLWRQYFQYGFWKGRFVRRHLSALKWRHMVPPVFVLVLAISAIAGLLGSQIAGQLFIATAVLYCAFLLVATALTAKQHGAKYVTILPIIFGCLHIAWGAGLWFGLLLPDFLSPKQWAR